MQGRIEHRIKTENNIQNILLDLPDFVTAYYYNIASSTTAKTCETYIKQIRGFFMFLKDNPSLVLPCDITEEKISRYLKKMQTKEIDGKIQATSFSYQQTIWSSLNGLCKYLVLKKDLQENPMSSIRRNHYKDTIIHNEITVNDIYKIMHILNNRIQNTQKSDTCYPWLLRDRAIIMLFIHTGMRCTALSEIDITDIDFSSDTLTVIDKRQTTHTYIVSNALKEVLQEWIMQRNRIVPDNTSPVFISTHKTRITSKTIYNLIEKYSEEALGYGISPHRLRAAFCTILYEQTHDIEFVREAVGHKSVSTTSRYIMKKENAKVKAVEILSKQFNLD